MSRYRSTPPVSFLDLLWNTLLGFVVLFVLAFISISDEKSQSKGLPTLGEYAVVVKWDDKSEDDVDTYVSDPNGNIAFFRAREVGLMHLERDDLGASNDTTKSDDGNIIKVEGNEERVILRGIVPGEYIVNVHMFRKRDPTPTKVGVSLLDIQGRGGTVTEREITLEKDGDEETAFRFTLTTEGRVTDINRLRHFFTKPN